MKRTRLWTLGLIVVGVALLLALMSVMTISAQEGPGDDEPRGPRERLMAVPETDGPPPGVVIEVSAGSSSASLAEPPPAPRGQRPLPPTRGGLAAMEETVLLSPPSNMGGPFGNSYFFDDVEAGTANWTATGLWHVVQDGVSPYPNSYSASHSWWFGQDSTGNYDVSGPAAVGALQTANPIAIPGAAPAAYLRFWSWEMTEDFGMGWDTRKVYTSTDGVNWAPAIYQTTASFAQWRRHRVDLSSEIGHSIYIKFEFDSIDGSNNGYRGWYLDDIAVGYDTVDVWVNVFSNEPYVTYGCAGCPAGMTPAGQLRLLEWPNTGATFNATASCAWAIAPPLPSPVGPAPWGWWGFNVTIPGGTALGAYQDATFAFTDTLVPAKTNAATLRVYHGGVHYVSHQIIDDGSGASWGNGNGKLDPGETVEMVVTLKNDMDYTRRQVNANMGSAPAMSWLTNWQVYGDIAAGASAPSVGKYLFDVPGGIAGGTPIQFNMIIGDLDGGNWTTFFTETVPLLSDLPTSARAGASPVYHRFQVRNNTGVPTSFDVSVSGNTWPTVPDPTRTITVGVGSSAPFTVTVDIPAGTAPGTVDAATVQVTSVASPTVSAAGRVSTTMMATGWVQVYYEDDYWLGTPNPHLAVIQSMDRWPLSRGHNPGWDPAVTAFRYHDTVAYAWVEGRTNTLGVGVNEVLFGARGLDGTVVIPNTRVADHSTASTNIQDQNPSITRVPGNGNVVVAWERYHQVGTVWVVDVYYAVYSADGTLLAGPTNLTNNTGAGVEDYNPAVEAFAWGGVALTWEHDIASIFDIMCAMLDGNGNVTQSPTNLTNNGGDWDDFEPVLTRLPSGGEILLTWEGELLSTAKSEAAYAILTSAGVITGGERGLHNALTANGSVNNAPDAVRLPDGRTVVAWSWFDGATGNDEIFYAVLASDHSVEVGPTLLANPTITNQGDVSVIGDGSGNAVLTWVEWPGGPPRDLYYAWLSSDGTVLTPPTIYWTAWNTFAFPGWRGQSSGGMVPPSVLFMPIVARNS